MVAEGFRDKPIEKKPFVAIQLGEEQLHIEARGRFTETDVKDYTPNSESEHLKVKVSEFEGPLDLLLYLIRRHQMDIFDIPIGKITSEYLSAMDQIKEYNIDLAGEFLLMAATLAQIKSKMLLPKEVIEEEEEDPRKDLVRRLLEYQRFKEIAEDLGSRNQLGRDMFSRRLNWADDFKGSDVFKTDSDADNKLAEIEVFEVLKSFSAILKRLKPTVAHAVQLDSISVRARMQEMIEYLKSTPRADFEKLVLAFGMQTRGNIIVTFLGILELTRLKLLKIMQDPEGNISVEGRLENLSVDDDMMLAELNEEDLPS